MKKNILLLMLITSVILGGCNFSSLSKNESKSNDAEQYLVGKKYSLKRARTSDKDFVIEFNQDETATLTEAHNEDVSETVDFTIFDENYYGMQHIKINSRALHTTNFFYDSKNQWLLFVGERAKDGNLTKGGELNTVTMDGKPHKNHYYELTKIDN